MGGSLTEQEIKKVSNGRKVFVETGTYKGHSTIEAAKLFEKVYTTEINNVLWEEAQKNALKELGESNIKFLLGDSIELLRKEILPNISFNKGVVFFMDAHQSGPDTSNNNKQLVPLMEELTIILSQKCLENCVFILDDLRFWKGQSTPAWDWAHISVQDVLQLFIAHNVDIKNFYEYNDRLWIYT